MDKLTEAELAALPEWAQDEWRTSRRLGECGSELSLEETFLNRALIELARALAPQPCGHPGACVVSAPYMGEVKSHSCGWCNDLSGYQVLKEHHSDHHVKADKQNRYVAQIKNLQAVVDEYRRWREHKITKVNKLTRQRDALRERLAAAELKNHAREAGVRLYKRQTEKRLAAADGLCDALNWMVLLNHGGSRGGEECSPSNRERDDALRAAKVAIGVWGEQ